MVSSLTYLIILLIRAYKIRIAIMKEINVKPGVFFTGTNGVTSIFAFTDAISTTGGLISPFLNSKSESSCEALA
ncbi:MAG: hypothetical protein C3F06_10475 [Candidatus Methanoperedenaceae archaeon]|nr:MAG: hypothetical protein C3F06_10475 [Candidatus Methanoperedenaceae archaeon]